MNRRDLVSSNGKKLGQMFPKHSKKSFNNLVTGDETWVYYFKPKRKCSNRVWATKNAVRPSIVKRQCRVKQVFYAIFFDNKGPIMQLPVPKGRTVTGTFYKNVVLKKLKSNFKRCCPKQDSSTCAFCMIMLPPIRHTL